MRKKKLATLNRHLVRELRHAKDWTQVFQECWMRELSRNAMLLEQLEAEVLLREDLERRIGQLDLS